MKRIGYVVLAEIVLAGVLVSLAGAQSSESLGDYARSVRKEEKKGSAKKYDNDNLPATDKISVVGNAQPETDNRGRQRGANDRCQCGAARRHLCRRDSRCPARRREETRSL